jgi:hypothetical protein
MNEGVPISTVVTIIVGLLSGAVSVYVVLLKIAVGTYEQSTEKRFIDLERASDEDEKELKKEVKQLTEKNHELEKSQIALQGTVNLLESNHNRSTGEIENIRDHMITKTEFETRMSGLEKVLDTFLKELRSPSVSRYGSSSSGGYPGVRTETPKGTPR